MIIKDINTIVATEKKSTREGFGKAFYELGKSNPDVVGLCADLTGSLKMDAFKNEFPERFFQAGVAEANMMGVAAGLATGGKIPFACTFANFATGRVYDQIRQSIAYSSKNVKICASHAGLSLGEDGATHQILEDIGLMQMLPHFIVINPCDYNQTMAATKAIAEHEGPAYLRFGRPGWPVFTKEDQKFEIGKAVQLSNGSDISIFATGHLVWQSVEASKELEKKGISVELINIHTIKPLDKQAILQSVAKTGCALAAEEHQRIGGMGASIAQLLSSENPVPMEFIAVDDRFGESGSPMDLINKYGLGVHDIVTAALKLLNRK